MDYKQLIHTVIDPFVNDPSTILIREIPQENEKDLLFVIVTKSEDTAHLIGKKGCVAEAIRKVISISDKLEGKRVHIKFESFDEKN